MKYRHQIQRKIFRTALAKKINDDKEKKINFNNLKTFVKENIRTKVNNFDDSSKTVFILRHKMPRDHADECNKVFR